MSTRGHHGMLLAADQSGGDPYWAKVSSLLHFDGANGAKTYTDETGKVWSGTSAGNSLSTAQSKFGGSSLSLTGSGWIKTSYSADFNFGTSDFTLEAFAYISGGSGTIRVIFGRQNDSGSGLAVQLRINASNKPELVLRDKTTGTILTVTGSSVAPANTFFHIAGVRADGTAYLFVDGINVGAGAFKGTLDDSTHGMIIGTTDGNTPSTSGAFVGYIDEARITKGVARYTSDFTPPTAPFPSK